MSPQRIQLRRTKGWRKPEGAIVVARPSKWGNPYRIPTDVASREAAVALFRQWLENPARYAIGPQRTAILANLDELRGHDLACWCPIDQPCHADVLLDLANQ